MKDKVTSVTKQDDAEIVHAGTKIILPEVPIPMDEEEAAIQLMRKAEQSKQPVSIHEEVECFPLEGAWALMQVMKSTFGWFNAKSRQSAFGPVPPTLVNLEVGVNQHEQVIWGNFCVPGVEGTFATGVSTTDGKMVFCIQGETTRKYESVVKKLAQQVRDYLADNSVYKGKAIYLKTRGNGRMDYNAPPSFLDLSKVNEAELTFSDHLKESITANVFTLVEKTAECRKAGIPLKRSILFEGKYGTGKTLTAYVTAKKAEENGWTFIYLDKVAGLQDALKFARQYAPAVLFCEDIDRALTGERTVSMDNILNTVDGIDSKNSELLTVFTTNDVESINKAMIRPGRLDAVISFVPPDAKAAEKLIHVYAGANLKAGEKVTEAAELLAGKIPAVIREVLDRAKLYAISLTGTAELTNDAIKHSAIGMQQHLKLLEEKAPELSLNERLGQSFKEVVNSGLEPTREKLDDVIASLED